jgi:predicted nucleotide-binding protein (sugar kinase/HSP70/actin superfamily)
MSLVIGIPKALHYYTFIPLWERFFYELGMKVVESGSTNKHIVDLGVKTTVTDACAPIKIFQGHVEALARKVDVVFIPRMVSFEGGYVFCPKFLGLSDMVKATVDDLPPVVDTRFDLRKGLTALLRALVRLGTELGAGRMKAFAAAVRAIRHFKQLGWTAYLRRDRGVGQSVEQGLRRGAEYGLARSVDYGVSGGAGRGVEHGAARGEVRNAEPDGDKLPVTIAVIGYPYIVHDPFLSCGMIDFLEKARVRVVTMEDVSNSEIEAQRDALSKQVFWHYSNRALKAAYHLMKHTEIDGLVHATAFGCGPDAIVDKFLEIDCKDEYGVPFLSLTIDEHSGQAGIVTRLEAFLDMILRKKGISGLQRSGGASPKESSLQDELDRPVVQGRQVS